MFLLTEFPLQTHHDRQLSAKCSSSLGATPEGVADRFRALGGGVGLPFRPGLERPENEGELGDTSPGLVGGVIELVEGRS